MTYTPRHAQDGPPPGRWITSPAGRRWAYGLALAVIAVCTGYGLLAETTAALWGNLAAAALGLAIVNTPQEARRE